MSESQNIAYNALQAGTATPEHQAVAAQHISALLSEGNNIQAELVQLRGELDRARLAARGRSISPNVFGRQSPLVVDVMDEDTRESAPSNLRSSYLKSVDRRNLDLLQCTKSMKTRARNL